MTGVSAATITDVALRDGLQNHPQTLPTDTKLALLDGLIAAGVRSLEAGSFVHPGLVPQMADTDEVFRRLPTAPGVDMMALVPNLRGAERAIAVGARSVRIVLSCSEGHSQANTHRSVDEGIAEAHQVVKLLRAEGNDVRLTGALATVFVCPFDGIVPLEQVDHVVSGLLDLDLDEITLSDTLGKADPDHIERIVAAMRERHPDTDFGLHLHDTFGMALAGAMAGLRCGVTRYDSALGGIGGCPFAPGAAGNVATEDLVFMFGSMGIDTGIDLDALSSVAVDLRAALASPLDSSVSRALGWAV